MRRLDFEHAVRFFTPLNRSERIHKNFIYRFSILGLSDQFAADCVGVGLSQVHKWDDGETIPPLVRRVWELESGRRLPKYSGFDNWSFKSGRIVTPDGAPYSEYQVRYALFLLDQLP